MDRRKPNYASAAVKVIFGMVLGWAMTHWFLVDSLRADQAQRQQQMEQLIEQLHQNLRRVQSGEQVELLDASITLTEQLSKANQSE